MAETWTNRGKLRIAESGINGKDFRMCIFTGTQVGANDPDLNTVADLDAVSGIAIHTERIALTSEAASEDDSLNRVLIDSDNVVFSAAPGVTAQGVAIYVEGANDAAREVWWIYTTGFPQPVDGGLNVNTPSGIAQGT